MDDQVLNLLLKRMDDHKDETNRRFDSMELHMKEVKKDVGSLKQWKWTTTGKVASLSAIGGLVLAGIFEFFRVK